MTDLNLLESVAASELVSAALIASLIPTLVDRGVLPAQDARDVYENALLLIEMKQSDEPAIQGIYEAARELIEAHLRSK
jgi:glycerol-3-phosphate O-acyltransferase